MPHTLCLIFLSYLRICMNRKCKFKGTLGPPSSTKTSKSTTFLSRILIILQVEVVGGYYYARV